MFTSLKYREYRLFWIGAAFSNIGIWALLAGHLWLMHSMTGSGFMLGLLTLSSSGPMLLLSMWGGVLADRINRLKLVTYSRATFAVLALITAVIIHYDMIQPWHLIFLSTTYGILVAFDIPSRQAIVPNLVPAKHLLNAIVMYSFLMGGANVIGPSISGPIIGIFGIEGLFFLVGASYIGTVFMLLRMKPIKQVYIKGNIRPIEDLLNGLRYIFENKPILILILTGITTGIFGSSFGTLLPIIAKGNVQHFLNLQLSSGIGGLLGMVMLASFVNVKNSIPTQISTGIGFGLCLAVFSQISWFPGSIAAIGLIGGLSVVFGTINNTLVQSLVSDKFRGRVMSIHQLSWGSSAIGGLMMGTMTEGIGATTTLLICGITTATLVGILTVSSAQKLSDETKRSIDDVINQ